MSRYTEVTTITQAQRFQLQGLLTLASYHFRMLEDVRNAACEITGEKRDSGGHTDDFTFGQWAPDADELLKKLEITVTDATA